MAWHNTGIRMMTLCLTVMTGTLFTACVMAADRGISVSQTRVIFKGDRKSEKVTISNQSKRVYLISSQVLRSPEGGSGEAETLPFVVTPPLFRLESGSRNTVLVMRNDTTSLPSDRESVFYLSFLAIPAVSKPADNHEMEAGMQPQMSVGIRSVIKLFYRPRALNMTASEAPEKLRFTLKDGVLHAENPTPYYLTLAQLQTDNKAVNVRAQGAMIPPYSSQNYRITGNVDEVSWAVVDDYGGVSRTFRSTVR